VKKDGRTDLSKKKNFRPEIRVCNDPKGQVGHASTYEGERSRANTPVTGERILRRKGEDSSLLVPKEEPFRGSKKRDSNNFITRRIGTPTQDDTMKWKKKDPPILHLGTGSLLLDSERRSKPL